MPLIESVVRSAPATSFSVCARRYQSDPGTMSETQPLLANEIDRYGNGPENYRNYPSTVQLQDVNAKGTRPGSVRPR